MIDTPDTPALAETPLDDDYDVVVVGARAAGAATALKLARSGVRVAAIDRATYGSDTLSTHLIARAGVLLLSRWGLLDTIRAAGTPRADRIVFNYGDDVVDIDVPAHGDVDGLYAPRRTLLDRTIVDAAVDSGAAVRHGTTVTALDRDNRGRVNGIEIDDRGGRRHISARIVVGADGMGSRTAQRVGATTLREEKAAAGVIYGYFTGLRDDVVENDFRQGRAAGIIPTNDGETCVWIGFPADDFRTNVANGVDAAFAAGVDASPALRERLADATLVSRLRSFPGRRGFLRQAWGAGWALVGDSAYFKDPVSAHGITDALIGAELLSEALVHTIRDGADERRELASYQLRRNELAAAMIPAVARVASFDWTPDTVADAYRDMSAAMGHENEFLESRDVAVLAA